MITHKTDVGSILLAALLLPLCLLHLDAQDFAPRRDARLREHAGGARTGQILFTENIGQWERGAGFQGVAGSTTIRFEKEGVSYSYLVDSTGEGSARKVSRAHTLRTDFIGGSRDLTIEGEKPSGTLFNYYLGPDSSRWFTGARGFEAVRYRGVYKGIDAVYHGNNGKLKYDFILSPGADVRAIRIRYRGATGLRVLRSGEMEVSTPFGSVMEAAPYSYQEIGGGRVEVEARYRLLGNNGYGFEIGAHDPRYPVVIDPCLSIEYTTYLGGGSYDLVTAMAVDSTGSSYAIGFTRAPDFPVRPEQQLEQENHIFVSKISSDGTSLLYSTVIARTYAGHYAVNAVPSTLHYESIGEDVEVTRNGEAVIALTTNISAMPTSNGAYQASRSPDNINSSCGPPVYQNFDCYITRLDGNGQLLWGSYLGGHDDDYVSDIALDATGNVHVTGLTVAPECGSRGDALNFPTTIPKERFGSADSVRSFETFVSTLSADGRQLRFSAIYGGTGEEFPTKIGVDPGGRIYLLGSTNSTDLPITANAYHKTSQPGAKSSVYDIYIARINPAAGQLEYSSYFVDYGGQGRPGLGVGPLYRRGSFPMLGGFDRQDRRQGLIVEGSSGVIVFAGSTRSGGLPVTAGAFQGGHRNGGSDSAGVDCFVVRMNIDNNQLLGSTYLGGSHFDGFGGIAYDRFGEIVVGLSSRSTDFPLSAVNIQPELRGEVDAVVATFSPDLQRLTYATFFGGTKLQGTYLWEQSVNGLISDREGGIYIFGGTSSLNIPLTPRSLFRSNDYYGGYIVKFRAPSAPRIGIGLGINFEPNLCGDVQNERQVIFNSGQLPLQIESIRFLVGKNFSLVNPPSFPLTLAPCDTFSVTIAFDGTDMECRTRGGDSLIITAPGAEQPRVTMPVTGRRSCVSFAFLDTVVNVQRFKLGSERYVGFSIYVRGDFDQYLTITPDPGNIGVFVPPAPIVRYAFPEGSWGIGFNVHAPDTGFFCETFTATIEPCMKTVKLRLCADVRSGFFDAVDSIDYGLISCREIIEPLVVRNPGNDTLIVNVLYVEGPNPLDLNFVDDVQSPRKVAPKDSTTFTFAVRPAGVGKHRSVIVFHTDEGGENGKEYRIPIMTELDSVAFRLTSIDLIGGFGEIVTLPVEYDPLVEGRVPLEELTLHLKFNPRMLEIAGLDPTGALMAGWEIARKNYVEDGAIITLRKGSGSNGVAGDGRLMNLQLKVLRGDSIATRLDLQLAGASKGCLYAEIDSGRVFQLNEECATGARLLFSDRRLLKQNLPNPATSLVAIPYRMPEEAYATLVLYDLNGGEVLRLIDGHRPAGDAEVAFDTRQLPPGIYYYRLTVGSTLSETRRMVIER